MASKPFTIPSAAEMYVWIEDMYAFGARRPGTAADHQCEDYLANRLRGMGFIDTLKNPIPIRVWEAESYKLEIAQSRGGEFQAAPSFYIPYTAFTPAGGTAGELLYVKPGVTITQPTDSWKNRIVVADINFPKLSINALEKIAFHKYDPGDTMKDSVHCAPWVRIHWNLYREAVKRGAAGFIGVLADHYPGGHEYYAPYGFREKDIHDKPVPGMWVDRETGARIRGLARGGGASARITLTGNLAPGVTHNVVASLPGNSGETMIVACHHDSPFESAVEDASGCAVVLAVAEHFIKACELSRTLVILFTAGHFYGSIGTRSYIERNAGRALDRTALEFHVEHIAREAKETPAGIELTGRPEFTGAFVPFNRQIRRALRKAIEQENLTRTIVFPAAGPFGEYPPTDGGDFFEHGVPLVNFISPPVYLLNSEDTLDKVAVDRLEPTARTVISVLRQLDKVPMKILRRNDYPLRGAAMKAVGKLIHVAAKSQGAY